MKHTLTVLVENHAGVLSRVSGLFARRGFNIDSLAVGVTENPEVSRMTIVVDGDDYTVEQVEKQLNKLIDVIKVKILPAGEFISEELLLVKVAADRETRSEIVQIADIFGAKIIDISRTVLTIRFSGDKTAVRNFEDMLKPYGIREMARTGVIAVESGSAVTRSEKAGD